MPADTPPNLRDFETLVRLMQHLRGPEGCPWDRKQSYATLRTYLLEECYEVLDAIDRGNRNDLAEELGDLLLQPVFLAQMANEEGQFTIHDAIQHINEKLIRRHPHIFGTETAESAEDVKRTWDSIKKQEKELRGEPHSQALLLDGVPSYLPALVEGAKLTAKAATVGFEWPDMDGVLAKVKEEADELAQASKGTNPAEVESELGDLLLTIVNLARFLRVDPEQALRGANSRFRRRFGHIEKRLTMTDSSLEEASLEQMDQLWHEAKQVEKDAGQEK